MELAAQAKGESVWGKPGAGAPNRNADGTVKTALKRIVDDRSE
jgi:hypothetical protein